MTLREQFVAVLRELPGFALGAPNRWLLRRHAPVNLDGTAVCMAHRRIVDWPCVEWRRADENRPST